MKFLLMLSLAAALWWLVRRAGRSLSGLSRGAGRPPAAPPEIMVACAFCELHLPQSEAVWHGATAFCGEAHRQAFAKRGNSR